MTSNNPTQWAIQRQIDGRYFDGQGWTEDPDRAFRTEDRADAVNFAAYLHRITPGWVRAVLIGQR